MRKIEVYPPCKNHPDRISKVASRQLCQSCYDKESRLRNITKIKAIDRNRKFVEKYGLTSTQVDALKDRQKNLCAICGLKVSNLQVDHDHVTGEVRGLLCVKCNLFIGFLEKRFYLLTRAFSYLGIDFGSVGISLDLLEKYLSPIRKVRK